MRLLFACIVLFAAATPLHAAAPGFQFKGVARLGTAGDDGPAAVAYASDGASYVAFTEAPAGDGAGGAVTDTQIRLTRFAPNGQPSWSVTVDGPKADTAAGVTIAADGNVYVVGRSLNGFQGQPNAGKSDVVLASFDPAGKKRWIRLVGGGGDDFAGGVAPGPGGGVYVAGWSDSPEVGDQENGGGVDALVARFETTGKLSWVRLDGGESDAYATAVDVAASSSVFVAGYTTRSGPNPHLDITLAKFLPSGTPVFTRTLGGRKDDKATAISVAPSGWIYLAGESASRTIAGQTNRGGIDVVVAKYHSSGRRIWVKLAGGSDDDHGLAIESPLKNAVYVGGATESNLDGPASGKDGFLLRFDASGHPPLVRRFGASGADRVHSIAVSDDTVLVGGVTDSPKLLGATSLGGADAFVARFR